MNKTEKFKNYSQRLIWLLAIAAFLGLWWGGVNNFYFHQDDVIALAMVARQWPSVMLLPNNEHINAIFFALLYFQWKLFGLNYPLYLAVSMIIWAAVLGFVYKIINLITKSGWWATVAIGAIVINRNWGEMVWWVTGQMMMVSTLLILLSFWYKLKLDSKKDFPKWWERVLWGISLILPGLAWGGGLIWPFISILFWGIELAGWKIKIKLPEVWVAGIAMLVIYFAIVGRSIGVNFRMSSWIESPIQILTFVGVGLWENVIGRFVWPFKNLWIKHIVILLVAGSWFKWGHKPMKWSKQVIFAWSMTVLTMLMYSLPRWQFGLGQAMAERYAFQPLIFGVIGIIAGYKEWKLNSNKIIMVTIMVVYLMVVGSIGFVKKVETWRIRPLQVKSWFAELDQWQPGQCYPNDYLPYYLVEQKIWRTEYIWPIFKKNFDPWEGESCK